MAPESSKDSMDIKIHLKRSNANNTFEKLQFENYSIKSFSEKCIFLTFELILYVTTYILVISVHLNVRIPKENKIPFYDSVT